jgi:hypothetical protein
MYETRHIDDAKTLAERNEEIKILNLQKNSLLMKLKKADGDLFKVMECLEGKLTQPQIERLLEIKKPPWTDDDLAVAVALLGISSKCYRSLQYVIISRH